MRIVGTQSLTSHPVWDIAIIIPKKGNPRENPLWRSSPERTRQPRIPFRMCFLFIFSSSPAGVLHILMIYISLALSLFLPLL